MVVGRQVIVEAAFGQPTEFDERAVERRHVVTFREEQIIAVRVGEVVGVHIQKFFVEINHQIGCRKACTDETTAVGGHSNNVLSNAESHVGKFFLFLKSHKKSYF